MWHFHGNGALPGVDRASDVTFPSIRLRLGCPRAISLSRMCASHCDAPDLASPSSDRAYARLAAADDARRRPAKALRLFRATCRMRTNMAGEISP